MASENQIIAAPTLIKRLPLPLRRLVGDFSNADRVVVGLDLKIA
jgi:circadian clock protein KaiB